jgi:Ion channel
MAIRIARERLGQVFYQRCFYLFAVVLLLIAGVPFMPPTPIGRLAIGGFNAFLVVATVAAVGRTVLSFVIVLLLAVPALLFQYLGVWTDQPEPLAAAWICDAALYAVAVSYLLRYVFRPEVMTADELYGAASSYLMLGVVWAFIYLLVSYSYPQSFLVGGQPAPLQPIDTLYFSFTVLTSTGFGDIVPLARQARGVCVVEQVTGTLFVAILIARLAGVYIPMSRDRY